MFPFFLCVAILLPILFSLLFIVNKNSMLQRTAVFFMGIVLLLSSGWALMQGRLVYQPTGELSEFLGNGFTAGNAALIIGMLLWSLRGKAWLQSLLFLGQAVLFGWFLWLSRGVGGSGSFVLDRLSGLMMLVTDGTGAIILLSAMQKTGVNESGHLSKIGRQPFFFAAASLLLGAMNGLLLANHLLWILFFWQMVVAGSLLLFASEGTQSSIKNAKKVAVMLALGGASLLAGIVLILSISGTLQLSALLMYKESALLLPALACFVVSGMVSCSLFPFQNTLLRSSSSKPYVSAMLQASTIVNAGVYLIFRVSPLFMNTWLAKMVVVIGAFSFAAAALLAAMKHDSKSILTYTTISSAGLAVALNCLPSLQAIFAAILLVLIHGITKSLLFLCSENRSHSRIPLRLSLLGGISMMMPPSGVPMGQWSAMEFSLREPLAAVLIAAGILFSMIAWTRFTGGCLKACDFSGDGGGVGLLSYTPQFILAFGMGALSFFYIPFTRFFVTPILKDNYGRFADIAQGDSNRFLIREISGVDPLWLFGVIIVSVTLVWFGIRTFGCRKKKDDFSLPSSVVPGPEAGLQGLDSMIIQENETGSAGSLTTDCVPSGSEDFVSMEVELDTEEMEADAKNNVHEPELIQNTEPPQRDLEQEASSELEIEEGLKNNNVIIDSPLRTSFQRTVFSIFPSAGKTYLYATVIAGGLVILMLEVLFR